MAHKKGGGSTRNGRDSQPKYRGVKVYGGQAVKAGGIIIRQVGTVYRPGKYVYVGRDWTLYSIVEGTVEFAGNKVNVIPLASVPRPAATWTPPPAKAQA